MLSDDNMSDVRRPRRTRADLRELLLQSALVEFAQHGFEGASTRAIAQRVDAHQPQINYHFESKESLWEAAVDHLFVQLQNAVSAAQPDEAMSDDDLALAFAESVRCFVRFAAEHPELNRIMSHESTTDNPRLRWMVEAHVQPLYDAVKGTWERLLAAGIAAPIDPVFVHYAIVGAASLPFANAPEAQLLSGCDPMDDDWIERHAEGVVAMLLPGLRPS